MQVIPGQRSTLFLMSFNMDSASRPERTVFRLRKWIIHRLVSLVDHLHLEKDEAVVEQIARCVRDTLCGWHDYETRSLFGFLWSQKPLGYIVGME